MNPPYRDIVADLEKGKNNLFDHSRPQSYLRNAETSSGVLEFPVQMADKDFNEGLLRAAANVRRQAPVDQHVSVAGVAPDVLPAGKHVRGTGHVEASTSTGAGSRVVDRHVVQGQEAESYSLAVTPETNTGGEQRRLEGEGATNAGTVTRPVRVRRKPDFLVVVDVNDPRFNRKHGE